MTAAHLWCRDTPTEREFDCKMCGHRVVVTERSDHRMCFCSEHCEKRYWKHADRYQRRKNLAAGHVVRLENWRIIE